MNENVVYKEKESSGFLKSGFYDSVNHDRKYAAEDMCKMVNGIFSEGVVRNYAEGMSVSPVSDDQDHTTSEIRIGSGKAYVNNRWVEVCSPLTMDMDGQSAGVYRLYLKIDTSLNEQNGRQASFVISTSQTPGTVPSTEKYYKMASFTYAPSNADKIINFTSRIGDSSIEGNLLYLVVNAIAGTTEDHEEIVDARTDFLGNSHDSIGEAIRSGDISVEQELEKLIEKGVVKCVLTRDSDLSERFSFGDLIYFNDSYSNGASGLYICRSSNGTVAGSTILANDYRSYWTPVTLDSIELATYRTIHRGCFIFDTMASEQHVNAGYYVAVFDNFGYTHLEKGLYKALTNTTIGAMLSTSTFNEQFEHVDILDSLTSVDGRIDRLVESGVVKNVINESSTGVYNAYDLVYLDADYSYNNARGLYLCLNDDTNLEDTLFVPSYRLYWTPVTIDSIALAIYATIHKNCVLFNPIPNVTWWRPINTGDYVLVLNTNGYSHLSLGVYKALQDTNTSRMTNPTDFDEYFESIDIVNKLNSIDAIKNSLEYRKIYDVTLESAIPVDSTYTINLPQPYPKDIKVFIANNVVTPASIRLNSNIIMSDDDKKPCLAAANATLGVLGIDVQSFGDFKECLANRPNAGAQGVIVLNANPIKAIEIILKSDSSNPIAAGSRIVVYGKNF